MISTALKNTFFYTLIFLIGASLTVAFSPFHIWPVAIICPALLLFFLEEKTAKQAFYIGASFGVGFFSTGVSWVYVSLHDYGQANAVLAGIMTFLMILVLVAYIALSAYLLNRYFNVKKGGITRYVIVFPSLWVLAEWCRGWVFTGFPWLFLGYSQIDTPLSGLAPIVSVFGVSWVVASSAGFLTLAMLCIKRARKKLPIHATPLFVATLFILTLWVAGFVCKKIQWTQADGAPVSVSLVQGNIAQTLKWTPDQVAKTLIVYEALTQPFWGNSHIILWPEAAITLFQTQAKTYLQHLDTLAKKHHSTLITGIPIAEEGENYNGMIALGEGTGSYKKRHLVPFGEFIPLRFLFAWLNDYVQIPMSDFSRGVRYQPLIQANHIPIAAFICYEIAYPSEVLDALPAGKLLIAVSDDSWFGKSIAPPQHVQIAQMRALETGRYLLMGTNDGVTAIINSKGQIVQAAPTFETAVLHGVVQPMSGATPWVRIGIYPVMGMMGVFLLFGWWRQKKDSPTKRF
jgi:apolipoprotein N-acyltransferase